MSNITLEVGGQILFNLAASYVPTALGDIELGTATDVALDLTSVADGAAEQSVKADLTANRGLAYSKKGEHDRAISDFTRVIEINPGYDKVYVDRGISYGKKGKYNLAIPDFNKAIEINSMCTKAYNNRAVSYYIKREYDKAWGDVRKVQSLGYQVYPEFLKALREASGRER